MVRVHKHLLLVTVFDGFLKTVGIWVTEKGFSSVSHEHTYTHAQMDMHAHAYICTHTYAHLYTCAHRYTQSLSLIYFYSYL